ncbi:hypothetical protein LTR85_003194 [Meristemomyces frigidus]|nr:hypothetical protein LTR85_003194 [Meristemomyces frigidus]
MVAPFSTVNVYAVRHGVQLANYVADVFARIKAHAKYRAIVEKGWSTVVAEEASSSAGTIG